MGGREKCEGENCSVPEVGKNVCGKCAGEICSVQKVAKRVCGRCAGNFAVFKRLQNTCDGIVRGDLVCSKGAKKRVLEMCEETCSDL